MRRLEKGMTQAELGRATRGDSSARAEGTVQFWERPGWWTPNRTLEAQSRVALARVLGESQGWLLKTDEPDPPDEADRLAYLETRVSEIGEAVAQLAERRAGERGTQGGNDEGVTLSSLRDDVQRLTETVLRVLGHLEELGVPAKQAPGPGSSGERPG